MDEALKDLITLLELEPLEENIFRGQSRDIGTPQVFGGQVLGQALAAASRTVEGRSVHSLHAYFLQRGDVNAPIVYEVDRARDGGTFSSRRVVAIQHGAQIFNMAASFQVAESGLAQHFERIEIVTEKSPDVYRRVLDRSGASAAEFVMVGNSLRSDVLPVIEIGARAVHIPYGITWQHEAVEVADLAVCWAQAGAMSELPELLTRL